MNARANARGQRRTRGGKGQRAGAKADARLSASGAAGGRARARRGRRDRLYMGTLWRNNNRGEERARQIMNASTRLMFTIAGCMLAVAAVGGIVACLAVLLL